MLRIEVIKTEDAWRREFRDWDRMASDNFMLQSPWLTSWWDGFGVDRELFVLKAVRGIQTLGYLPLCMKRSLLYGRELMFLGSAQASSDDLSMIHDEGHDVECAMGFARFLAQADGRNSWDRLNLDGVQMSNPKTDLLHRELELAGIELLDKPGPSCWKLSLEGGWDGVLKRASKRTRRMLRSLFRDFVDTGRAKIVYPHTLEDALEQIMLTSHLHQKRWRSKNMAGCFAEGSFERFMSTVAEKLWEQGKLYSALLHMDGDVVAGCIGFKNPRSLSFYLVGMDPEKTENRPGWILNSLAIQHAIAQGHDVFDFMRGDEEYKDRFGAVGTPQTRWVAAAPRVVPRLRHAAYYWGTQLRDWWGTPTERGSAILSAETAEPSNDS